MPAPTGYSDEEFEKLLQEIDEFSPSAVNTGLGLGFSVPPSVDNIDLVTTLSELPPSLTNDISSHFSTSPEDEDIRVRHMQKQLDSLQIEVDYLRSMADQLTTYINSLRPWMMEVTEALDKLGEAPASATELEFKLD